MSYNILRTTYKIGDFLAWNKSDSLILNPDFQRRSVWDSKSKSYLIDTIVRGLPIPVIILRDQITDLKSYVSKKEVVDGQQRLRTVISYITENFEPGKEFKLSKTHNTEYGDNSFKTLPDKIKQAILDYEFFVHVLPSSISNREILEIFSRMNSTGVRLNDQELRNATFFGEFKTLAFNLANEFYDYWINWKIFSDRKISRMDEVELVNDFLIIAINGVERRSPESITNYYKNYNEEDSIENRDIIVKQIKNIMDFLEASLGREILSKSEFRKTPLFYSLFANIYNNQYLKNNSTKKVNIIKNTFKKKIVEISDLVSKSRLEWKRDKKVKSIPEKVFIGFTSATNLKENRDLVYDYLNEILFQ